MPGTRRIAHALPARLLALSHHRVTSAALTVERGAGHPCHRQGQGRGPGVCSNLIDKLDEELSAATEDYDYAAQQLEDTQAKVKKTSTNITKAESGPRRPPRTSSTSGW